MTVVEPPVVTVKVLPDTLCGFVRSSVKVTWVQVETLTPGRSYQVGMSDGGPPS